MIFWTFPYITGCRLCRRPPKLEEYNIDLWFFEFLGPRDHANLVRIELSSKLPQELRQIIEYCLKLEPQTFEKITFNTFVKNWTSIGVSSQTGWGKVTVMTVGSFHVFIKRVTLICNLQVKVHVFLKTSISIFSLWTIYSLWRTDIWGVYFFRI